MKKLLNISLCFILTLNFGYSQSIKRSVICSFGSSTSNSTTYLSETFGQPSSIGTVSDGNNYIRQGFQQPIGCVGGTIFSTTNPFICSGSSITVGTSTYSTTGTYVDSLVTVFGCDSVITTDLTLWATTLSTSTISSCDSLPWNNSVYTSSGTYTYSTTNSNGCDSIATLELTINPPTTSTTTESACDSLLWNGTIYNSTGTYSYTTTNSNGCDSIATLELNINNSVKTTDTITICSGDSVTVGNSTYSLAGTYTDSLLTLAGCDSIVTTNLSVNTPPYSGLPNPFSFCLDVFTNQQTFDLNYLLTNQDSNGVWYDANGSVNNIISTSSFAEGVYSYTYTVLGQAPCNNTTTSTYLTLYAIPITTYTSENISCFGSCDGSASITVQNSVNNTYNWSDGSIDSLANNLCVGTHWVTTTNPDNCTVTDTITLTEPAVIAVELYITPASCNGGDDGAISTFVIGGTLPYFYDWDMGVDTSAVSNLTMGSYQLLLADANGCVVDTTVQISEPTEIDITSIANNVTCYGLANGTIAIDVTGGISPYAYQWTNGETTADITALIAGNYTLNITDDNGCTAIENISINQPLLLEVNAEATNASCEEKPDGSISTAPYGGTLPYTYLWSNGQITDYLENLYTGDYWVKVSDFNGCDKTDSVFVGYNDFEDCFFIPTAFTPNGDGIHDDWEIDGVDLFPTITVHVFNRWGQLLFESTGYSARWDGTHNGNDLPIASYYYLIDLNDGREPFKGTVTIKR